VIPAGRSIRHKNKNFYAAGLCRVFSFVRNIFIQMFVHKISKKAQLLRTLDRHFEHATTTDEVML
jgi:hypothetical protein